MSSYDAKKIEEYQLILMKNPRSKVFAALAETYRKMDMHEEALELTPFYADRMVDISTDGIVPGADEHKAEQDVVGILETYEKYGKNPATLQRYLALHAEIQGWMA